MVSRQKPADAVGVEVAVLAGLESGEPPEARVAAGPRLTVMP
jgi:hypothetical protein